MSTTPKAQLVKAAVVDLLRAIVGDGGETYWFTPHLVQSCYRWPDKLKDASVGDGSPATVYVVVSDVVTYREAGSSGLMSGSVQVYILMHQRAAVDTAQDELDLAADRMERDVVAALVADVTLGGLTENVMDEEGLQVEAYDVEGWVARKLRTTVPLGSFVKGSDL